MVTPFGSPVEPEVYMTYTGSESVTSATAASTAAASSGSRSSSSSSSTGAPPVSRSPSFAASSAFVTMAEGPRFEIIFRSRSTGAAESVGT